MTTKKYFAVRGPHAGYIVSAKYWNFCGCGLCRECYGMNKKYKLYKRGELIRRMIAEPEIESDFIPLADYYDRKELFKLAMKHGVKVKR